MLLDIDEKVFVSGDASLVAPVFQLIKYTIEGRHTWRPSTGVAALALSFIETNFPSLVSWREYLMSAAKASAWQSSDPYAVQVTPVNVETLADELALAAVVLVENRRNDGSFLRAVFAAYDDRLVTALDRHWLDIVHSGGTGEQEYLADVLADRFTQVCRVLVLKDNDKLSDTAQEDPCPWPPDEPWWHIWQRHEVENYLPDAVLRLSEHPRASALLRHLREMTPEQQRWIDMKRGLKKCAKPCFDTVAEETRRVWHSGFGDHLPKPLVPAGVTLTVDDFRELGEDVDAELRLLLTKILRLL